MDTQNNIPLYVDNSASKSIGAWRMTLKVFGVIFIVIGVFCIMLGMNPNTPSALMYYLIAAGSAFLLALSFFFVSAAMNGAKVITEASEYIKAKIELEHPINIE